MKRLLGFVLLCITLGELSPALAEGIGMVTGSKTGTYFQFGNDIAQTARSVGLDILVKESEGSIDNIKRLTSAENAAFGIVQSDVLGFLSRSTNAEMRRIADRLRLILPFYKEEVHLFANRSIQKFSDLQGKRLVVGKQGSGNWLTAVNLLQMTGVKPAVELNLDPLEAASAVLKGEADAMIYVAGKPVALFDKLGKLREKPEFAPLFQNVHFVPLDDTIMRREYLPSEIGPDDYPWLTEKTPTIAVKAVLMGFDFSGKQTPYFRQRCEELGRLGQVMRANLATLQQTGHPKWKEVNLDDSVGTWKLDSCSRKATGRTDITRELEKILLNQLPTLVGAARG